MGDGSYAHVVIDKLVLNGRVLMNELALSIPPNTRLGLTGPSGCGKTTLLRSILRGVLPTGSIGEVSLGLTPVGYVAQHSAILPWLSIRANLESLPMGRNGMSPKEALSICGLTKVEDSFPSELSGGELQRANLASMFVLAPPLTLADEPLSEVGVAQRSELLYSWSECLSGFEASLLLVAHDLDTLLLLSDEVIVLNGDPAVAAGSLNLCETHPRNLFEVQSESWSENRLRLTDLLMEDS